MVICHIGHLAVLVEAAFCQGFPKGFDSPRLVRFRGVHDALAWKDLMAEVDLTILSIAQAAPGAKGMGQGMVLTELVTQLHHLAESAAADGTAADPAGIRGVGGGSRATAAVCR